MAEKTPIEHLTQDYIAIDTNVFGHLTDPEQNDGRHIHKLLKIPRDKKIGLLIDNSSRIYNEYQHHLCPKKLKAKQRTTEAQIIRYWIHLAPKKIIKVDQNTPLWNSISAVISGERQENDRTFVYVAFNAGRTLISNDQRDIVNRRGQLTSSCTDCCPAGAGIMTSQEAYNRARSHEHSKNGGAE